MATPTSNNEVSQQNYLSPGVSITDRSQKANVEYILNPSTLGKKKCCYCSTTSTQSKRKKGGQEELVNISSKPNNCMCCSDAWMLFYFHSSWNGKCIYLNLVLRNCYLPHFLSTLITISPWKILIEDHGIHHILTVRHNIPIENTGRFPHQIPTTSPTMTTRASNWAGA